MKTLKLNILISEEWKSLIEQDQRNYSACVRYSFNRFISNDQSKINLYKDTFEKFDIGSHFVTSANREAKSIVSRFDDKEKIPTYHFGGSAQKELYEGKITKKRIQEEKESRPIL